MGRSGLQGTWKARGIASAWKASSLVLGECTGRRQRRSLLQPCSVPASLAHSVRVPETSPPLGHRHPLLGQCVCGGLQVRPGTCLSCLVLRSRTVTMWPCVGLAQTAALLQTARAIEMVVQKKKNVFPFLSFFPLGCLCPQEPGPACGQLRWATPAV